MCAILIDIFRNVIAYWILIFTMQYICSAHINLNKKNLCLCTIMSTLLYFLLHQYPIPCMLVLVVLTVLLFSPRKGKDLLLFFPAFIIYFVLTVIPEALLTEVYPQFNGYILINGYSLSVISLAIDVTLFLLLILLRYVLVKYETTIQLNAKEILGCIGLLFFAMVDGALLIATNKTNMHPAGSYLWKTIFVLALVLSVAYYLYTLIESRVRIYRQTLSRSETEYLRVQLDSLQDVKENEEQVKHLRHDLNNHLAVIQSLCEDGSYEEIKDYTEHLRNDIVLAGHNVLTGNKVADLVVRSKLKTAVAHNIDFTFSGSLEHLSSMDAPDICGLLANAYDNAIEACLSQSNAYIRTEVSTTRNYTVIQITNSVTGKVPIRSNRIATTKQDKQSHGYGIDIMNRIAHKYNGSCTLRSSDKELTVKIVLLTNCSNNNSYKKDQSSFG